MLGPTRHARRPFLLSPESLASGSEPVRFECAHEAIRTRLANPLRRDMVESTFGVHTVARASIRMLGNMSAPAIIPALKPLTWARNCQQNSSQQI